MFENVENASSACPITCISACSNAYIHARSHTSMHGCMQEMYECMTCIHVFIHASMLPCMRNAYINACMAACLQPYVSNGTNILQMVIYPRGFPNKPKFASLGGGNPLGDLPRPAKKAVPVVRFKALISSRFMVPSQTVFFSQLHTT